MRLVAVVIVAIASGVFLSRESDRLKVWSGFLLSPGCGVFYR